jgi:branched-chain amino acid transport system substrate-binding protein
MAAPPRLSAPLGAAWVFWLLGLLAAAACLPAGAKSGTRPADLLSQAETAYSQGRFGLSADYYRQFLAAEAEPPRLEAILAAYGLASEKAGRFPEAAQAYERLLSRFPSGEFAGEAGYRLVSVHLAAGDGAAAERLAGRLKAAETDPGRRAELGLALGRAQWLTGNFKESAASFLEVFKGGGGPARRQEAARQGVLGSLARLDYKTLAALQQSSGLDFPGPEAAYLLIYQTASAGDQDHAGALADYFRRYYPENRLRAQVEAVLQALAAKAALPAPAFGIEYDPRAEVEVALKSQAGTAPDQVTAVQLPPGGAAVAVLLPLSDRKGAGRFAREVARGLELAVKEQAPGQVGLTVLDTGGLPEQAVRHFNQAADDPRVLAVVGPLLRDEAAAVAAAAGRSGPPVIVISQAPELPGSGPNVFRLFLTPGHQAEALVRHAVRTEKHNDLGVIHPDDNYGRLVLAAFKAEAARQGARVTVADSYSPKNPDLEAVASRLTGGQGARLASSRQGVRKVSTDYQAQVACGILYLPDSPGPVARLLPLLAFHDVTRLPYMGSALWLDDPDFLAGSARYLQGAVVPAPITELSQRPESLRFFNSFQQAYGHAPNQFAAYGYDAGLALIQALGQGAASREDLRRALAKGGQTPGATGPFSFGQDGEYRVEPALLTIQEREFVLLREPGPFR